MQKIKFINANGVEIDFTSGCYGVTGWKGLSNANLNLQTQKVPNYDGSVYIDGLLENRTIELTLCIDDNNNLAVRYAKRKELCEVLNPKLGEGYLVYKNDMYERRIKAIPELPVIENKNSDESGSVKAALSFICPDVYWEDVEETTVNLRSFEEVTVNNEGDIPCPVKIEADCWNIPAYSIKNDTQKIDLKNISDCDKVFINTAQGEKEVTSEDLRFNAVKMPLYFFEIIYNGSIYVGTSYNGIYYSYDCNTWNLIGISGYFYSVTYSEDLKLFCTVGAYGKIYTSPDGITWTQQAGSTFYNYTLRSVCWSSDLNLFIAVGYQTILYSINGKDWTRLAFSSDNFYCVKYIHKLEKFFAVCDGGKIYSSSNGLSWTNIATVDSVSLKSITYSEELELLCTVGSNGSIYTSSDETSWTSQTSGTTAELNCVVVIDVLSLFVAVGSSGTILTSSDGTNWTSVTSGITGTLSQIAYFANLGFAYLSTNVGGGVEGTLYKTINFESFTSLYSLNYNMMSVCYSKKLKKYCAVGTSASIYTSSDGITWVEQVSGLSQSLSLNSIIYSEELELFVAVGNSGRIITSSDGITWVNGSSGQSYNLFGITYSEELNLFCAVGYYGKIYTSSNGTSWTSQTSGTTKTLTSVTYSEELSLFVAVGSSGTILTSSDGTNWTSVTSGITDELKSVCYSKKLNLFCIVGNSGRIITSSDGITWSSKTKGSYMFVSIIYSEELEIFCAISSYGEVLTSSDGVTWKLQINTAKLVTYGLCNNNDNFIIVGSKYIGISNFIKNINIISRLSSDSDMTFSLKPGSNNLMVYNTARTFNSRLTYRQRYIGL